MATYKQTVEKFMAKINLIFNSKPKRREPGDGSDGYCDCIGLIIGAIRRMGLKWTGIHGSNYAARREITGLTKLTSKSQLEFGDVVLKAVPKGHPNWRLPSRYFKGGSYYNGDLNDYYHAGVVASINPFQIKHMSSKMTIDTKIDVTYPWNYKGKLLKLVAASSDIPTPTPTPTPDPAQYKKAVVVAKSGSTVNLRQTPSKASRIMIRVPLGKTVTITKPGETWAAVKYDNFSGYMMAEFLDTIGDGKGKY